VSLTGIDGLDGLARERERARALTTGCATLAQPQTCELSARVRASRLVPTPLRREPVHAGNIPRLWLEVSGRADDASVRRNPLRRVMETNSGFQPVRV